MNPENSYLLAVAYMIDRGTFRKVKAGELTSARRSVNGGTNGLSKVNSEYARWLDILKQSKTSTKKKSGRGLSSSGKKSKGSTNKTRNFKIIGILALAAVVVGGSVAISMYLEKNK